MARTAACVVQNNTVTASIGSGITVSQSNSFPVFTGPNTGLSLDHNNVSQSLRGIRILADAMFVNSAINNNNTFENVLFGILFEAGSGNTIGHNNADDNGDTGIYNQGGTANTFLQNSMFGNAVVDARDDNRARTPGAGTSATPTPRPGRSAA